MILSMKNQQYLENLIFYAEKALALYKTTLEWRLIWERKCKDLKDCSATWAEFAMVYPDFVSMIHVQHCICCNE